MNNSDNANTREIKSCLKKIVNLSTIFADFSKLKIENRKYDKVDKYYGWKHLLIMLFS